MEAENTGMPTDPSGGKLKQNVSLCQSISKGARQWYIKHLDNNFSIPTNTTKTKAKTKQQKNPSDRSQSYEQRAVRTVAFSHSPGCNAAPLVLCTVLDEAEAELGLKTSSCRNDLVLLALRVSKEV